MEDNLSVLIPAEHFEAFSSVIEAGLKRAKISQEARVNLASWWEAEKAMISDEITNRSSVEL